MNAVVGREVELAPKGHDSSNIGICAARIDVANNPGASECAVGPPELVPEAAVRGGEIQNASEDGLEIHAGKRAGSFDQLCPRRRSIALPELVRDGEIESVSHDDRRARDPWRRNRSHIDVLDTVSRPGRRRRDQERREAAKKNAAS